MCNLMLGISKLIAEQYNLKKGSKKGSQIFSHVAKNSLRYSALQGLKSVCPPVAGCSVAS